MYSPIQIIEILCKKKVNTWLLYINIGITIHTLKWVDSEFCVIRHFLSENQLNFRKSIFGSLITFLRRPIVLKIGFVFAWGRTDESYTCCCFKTF